MAAPDTQTQTIDTSGGIMPMGTLVSNTGTATYAPLTIIPAFGTTVTSARLTGAGGNPTVAQFQGAVAAAINYFDTNFTSAVPAVVTNGTISNGVTVQIQFDYGQIGNTAMGAGAGGSSYGLTVFNGGDYAALAVALKPVLPFLPAADPTGGGLFLEPFAQGQVLGLAGPPSGPAGYVGLNAISNGVTLNYDLANQTLPGKIGAVGALEHEISEVFGRVADLGVIGSNTYTILDLYRFNGAGTRALIAGTADYFSLNGGTTNLAGFNNHNNGGDAGDWAASVPNDAFAAFLITGNTVAVTAVDQQVLGAIGLIPVTAQQTSNRAMLWIGGAAANFGVAANWNDTSNVLSPAVNAIGATDIGSFMTNGGSIGSTGTAATLRFGGPSQWLLGTGTTLTAASAAGVIVGQGGNGALALSGGGSLISQGGTDLVSGTGTLAASLSVSGGSWSSTGSLLAGTSGLGFVSVTAGGTVSAGGAAIVASTTAASGSSVNVSGAGSVLNVAGALNVGLGGSGGLSISAGGSVGAGALDSGVSGTGIGQISVVGTGSHLTVAGAFVIADGGTGALSVLGGGTVTAASVTIGAATGSSGAVFVSGAGSLLQASGVLNIGTPNGIGQLTVGPGAHVNAPVINYYGKVVLEGGTIDPHVQVLTPGNGISGAGAVIADVILLEGTIQAGTGKPGNNLLTVQGTVVGGGTWTQNGTAQPQVARRQGILEIGTGGTLEIAGPVLNVATFTVADDLVPSNTYAVSKSVVDVIFDDGTGVLQLDQIGSFRGTIGALTSGDRFVISGGTLSALAILNGTTLTVADSGNGGIDTILFSTLPLDASGFQIVNGNTIVACFAAGTRIATPSGPIAVETLAVGDEVTTRLGGSGLIVWAGSREVDCAAHPSPASVWPICVSAGAFGAGMPERDLFVSPDHALFVDGVLVPAKRLINGRTVRQVEVDTVSYHHIALAAHDVVLAEGMPAETFLDMRGRGTDAVARRWEMAGCAALMVMPRGQMSALSPR